MAQRDGVLNVEGILVDIVGPVKTEERASARQIVGDDSGLQIGVGLVSGIEDGTLVGIGDTRKKQEVPVGVRDTPGYKRGP